MSSTSSNSLRVSGMNSGWDTESMVNALTAATKLKITKNERKVLKLQAQQDAYRDIISKMTNFQKKYFDTLNTATNLKSPSMFNKYSASISMNGTDTKPAGVTVTSSANANAGTYNVKVNNVATQTTFKTNSLGADTKINLSDYTGADAVSQTYGMSVTVGSTTKNITFNGGATQDDVINNINTALEAFGTSNTGAGLVKIDTDGVFASSSKNAISISGVGQMQNTSSLDMSNITSGTNKFTIQVGDETKTISFQTVSKDYFDDMYDADGNVADEDKVELYDTVKDDLYNYNSYNSYNKWKETATDSDKEALFQRAYTSAQQKQEQTYFDRAYTAAKKTAYNNAVKDGTISSNKEDEKYVSLDDWNGFTEENYKATDAYTEFKKDYEENKRLDPDLYKGATYSETNAYKEFIYSGIESEEAFEASVTKNDIVNHLNTSNMRNSIGAVEFSDGTKLSVEFDTEEKNSLDEEGESIITQTYVTAANITATKETTSKDPVTGADVVTSEEMAFSISAASDSVNNLGAASSTQATIVSSSTKLSELNLTANAEGKYTFSINGTDFSFDGDTTIKNMMKTVNDSKAGVTMSFTTLTNNFTIATDEYGTGASLEFIDGSEGLLSKLGISTANGTMTQGKNLEIEINGELVETASNSFTVDGTTFTFSAGSEGTEFKADVQRDYTDAIAAVKSFVEDYNTLIKDVYGYLDDEPNSDYYFLSDNDKEDMELSDTQEEKWETMAKKGLLYNDSSTSGIMSKLRTTLYSGIELADGTNFGLYSMGISTSDDWSSHGTLVLDEAALTKAFETNADAISELFTTKDTGIMQQFNTVLDSAVKTTGAREEKGILVQKAGVEATSSATDNSIYDQIKSLKTLISTLEERYDNEQDRYWKQFSNMESSLSSLNSQTSSITSLLS